MQQPNSLVHWRVVAAGLVAAGVALLVQPGVHVPALRWWHGAILLASGALIGATSGGRRRDLVGYAALFVAWQVALARLLVAPPWAAYPHLLPPAQWRREAAALVVIVLQTVVVARGLRRLAPELEQLRAWAARHPARFLVAALAIAGSLAVPTRDLVASAVELLVAGLLMVIAACAAMQVASAAADDGVGSLHAWLDQRLSLPGSHSGSRRWDGAFPAVVALGVVVAAALVSVLVFEGMPHIDDSVSYMFHARYFALGRPFLDAPPDSAAFPVDEILIDRGRWFGYGFPGWPAVLAIGVRTATPWLVNPCLAGVTVLVAHRLVGSLADRGTANTAILLLAASPWMLFMSGEYMPHPLALCCALLAFLAAVRLREGASIAWTVPAGASLGLLALVRPLDAALAAVLVTLLLAVSAEGRTRISAVPIIAGLSALVAAVVVPYNRLLTGSSRYTPQMMWTDRRWGPGLDRIGFGSDIGIRAWPNIDPLPGHGAADVVLNLNKNLFITQLDLFGWSFGSLLLCVVALAIARRDALRSPWWWMVGLFVVGYSAYWFSGGPDLGARYWYPAIVGFTVLTVAGAVALARGWARPRGARGVAAVVALASVAALLTNVPSMAVGKYYRYRGVGGDVRALADSAGIHDALVFVRTSDRPRYQSAFNLNPVPLDAPGNIYAVDAGPASRARVVQRLPDRPVWLIATDSVTEVFHVLAGPLPAGRIP